MPENNNDDDPKQRSEDDAKHRFNNLVKKAADDNVVIQAWLKAMFNRVDFWEEMGKSISKRIDKKIKLHDKDCSYRKDHDEYHDLYEYRWGFRKTIFENFLKILKWMILIIIGLSIIAFAPSLWDKAVALWKLL